MNTNIIVEVPTIGESGKVRWTDESIVLLKATNTAAKNTALIQDALNKGGDITILGEPDCLINETLIIYSDTHISHAPGTELVCANEAQGTFNHYRNANFSSLQNPITSIVATQIGAINEFIATATFTNTPDATVVAGGYLLINNDPTGFYNGIWKLDTVDSIAKTATFTVGMATRIPASVGATITFSGFISNGTSGTPGTVLMVKTENDYALNRAFNNTSNYLQGTGVTASTTLTAPITGRGGSGTYTVNNSQAVGTAAAPVTFTVNTELYGIAADANITIEGGALDSNFYDGSFTARTASTDSEAYKDFSICFNNVINPVIKDIEINNCKKYRVCIANSQNAKVLNLFGVSFSDGVKIYGPAFGTPTVDGVYGTMGDDGVSFQTVDPSPTYAGYMPPNSGGCFYGGGVMRNSKGHVNGYNGHSVLYPNGGKTSGTFDGLFMYGMYISENCGSSLNPLVEDYNSIRTGAAFACESGGTTGYIDNIRVINPIGKIAGGSHNSASQITNIDSLTVENHITSKNGANSLCDWYSTKFRKLLFLNSDITNSGLGATGPYFAWGDNNVTIDILHFESPRLSNKSVTSGFASGGVWLYGRRAASFVASIANIIINNPTIADLSCQLVNAGAAEISGTPNLFIRNAVSLVTGNPTSLSVGSTQNYNIFIDGFRQTAWTPFNFYGTGNISLSAKNIEGVAALYSNVQANLTLRDYGPTRAIQRSTPASGATVTATNLNGYNRLLIAPAGTIAALTLALPTTPINGEVLELYCTQEVTALTVTNGTLAGITSGVTGLAAGYSRRLTYSAADVLWV